MAYVSESTIRAPISKAVLHYTAGSRSRSRPKAQHAEANWNRHEQSVPVDSIPRGEKHSSGSNQQRGSSDYNLDYQNSMQRSPAVGSERGPVDRPKRTHPEKPRKGKTTKSPANGQAKHSTEDEPAHGDDSIERASQQRSLSDDVRDVTIVGAASPGAKTSNCSFKQSLHRSKTTGSEAMAAAAVGSSTGKMEKTATASKAARKHPGFFSSLFKPPQPTAPEKVTCLTCLSDDVPISKSAKLPCSHRMCHACLKRIFTMSVTDPQHMPPRCCTSDHIPLKHVEKLFDMKFKMKWNKKYQEYTTKNRIYCPTKGCGEWIKPSHVFLDTSAGPTGGRKFGKCSKCKTKVCCLCNGKWHSGKDCPKDEATKTFVEMAKEKGWQRCYNCSAMVELKEGCNHMTCRCTAEFCMICGSKWKTCDCPWFNYDGGHGDRLDYMNVPQEVSAFNDGNVAMRNPVRYQEELDRRREQEQQDEAIARRLQLLGIDDDDLTARAASGILELGNAMAYFMNDRFVQPPTGLLAGNGLPNEHDSIQTSMAHNVTGRERANTPSPPPDRLRQRNTRNRDMGLSTSPDLPPAQIPTAISRTSNNRSSTRRSERMIPRRDIVSCHAELAHNRPGGNLRASYSGSRHSARGHGRSSTTRGQFVGSRSYQLRQTSV